MKRRRPGFSSAAGLSLAMLVVVAAVSGCTTQRREIGWCTVGGGVAGALVGGAIGIGIGGREGVANGNSHDNSTTTAVIADTAGVVGGLALGAVIGHYACDPIIHPPPPPPTPGASSPMDNP